MAIQRDVLSRPTRPSRDNPRSITRDNPRSVTSKKVMASPTQVKKRREREDKPQFVPANGSSVRPNVAALTGANNAVGINQADYRSTAQAGSLGGFGAMLPKVSDFFSGLSSTLSNIGGPPGVGGKRPPLSQNQIQNIQSPFQSYPRARFDTEGLSTPAPLPNPVVGTYTIPTGAESGMYRGNVDRPFYNELGSLLNQARTNISGLSETQLRKLASYGLVEKASAPTNIFSDVYGGGGTGYGGGGYPRRRGGGGGRGGGTAGGYTYGNNSVAAQVLNWRVATG